MLMYRLSDFTFTIAKIRSVFFCKMILKTLFSTAAYFKIFYDF